MSLNWGAPEKPTIEFQSTSSEEDVVSEYNLITEVISITFQSTSSEEDVVSYYISL